MTIILRVFLVVGALTYLAVQKQEAGPSTAAPDRKPPVDITALSAAWNSLPTGARDEIVRAGAAEVARRFSTGRPSQDTLASNDRKPAWRGALD